MIELYIYIYNYILKITILMNLKVTLTCLWRFQCNTLFWVNTTQFLDLSIASQYCLFKCLYCLNMTFLSSQSYLTHPVPAVTHCRPILFHFGFCTSQLQSYCAWWSFLHESQSMSLLCTSSLLCTEAATLSSEVTAGLMSGAGFLIPLFLGFFSQLCVIFCVSGPFQAAEGSNAA